MRVIEIPQPIKLDIRPEENGGVEPELFTFHQFIRTMLRDQKFGQNLEWLEAAADIRSVLNDKGIGESMSLSEDLWNKLSQVCSGPTGGYNPAVMVQAIGFVHAVTKAKLRK